MASNKKINYVSNHKKQIKPTLYAKYELNKVTFDVNGGQGEKKEVDRAK